MAASPLVLLVLLSLLPLIAIARPWAWEEEDCICPTLYPNGTAKCQEPEHQYELDLIIILKGCETAVHAPHMMEKSVHRVGRRYTNRCAYWWRTDTDQFIYGCHSVEDVSCPWSYKFRAYMVFGCQERDGVLYHRYVDTTKLYKWLEISQVFADQEDPCDEPEEVAKKYDDYYPLEQVDGVNVTITANLNDVYVE